MDERSKSQRLLRRGPSSLDWMVRIQPAQLEPFVFKATFERSGTAVGVLDARYLYGDGDLAVFLEDLGAVAPAIWSLLRSLEARGAAEIAIDITEEAMEVLVRGKRA